MSATIQNNGSTAVRCDDWLCGAEVSNVKLCEEGGK